jgi:hypothetical protein
MASPSPFISGTLLIRISFDMGRLFPEGGETADGGLNRRGKEYPREDPFPAWERTHEA